MCGGRLNMCLRRRICVCHERQIYVMKDGLVLQKALCCEMRVFSPLKAILVVVRDDDMLCEANMVALKGNYMP